MNWILEPLQCSNTPDDNTVQGESDLQRRKSKRKLNVKQLAELFHNIDSLLDINDDANLNRHYGRECFSVIKNQTGRRREASNKVQTIKDLYYYLNRAWRDLFLGPH